MSKAKRQHWSERQTVTCPACDGTGTRISVFYAEACPTCDGAGLLFEGDPDPMPADVAVLVLRQQMLDLEERLGNLRRLMLHEPEFRAARKAYRKRMSDQAERRAHQSATGKWFD